MISIFPRTRRSASAAALATDDMSARAVVDLRHATAYRLLDRVLHSTEAI